MSGVLEEVARRQPEVAVQVDGIVAKMTREDRWHRARRLGVVPDAPVDVTGRRPRIPSRGRGGTPPVPRAAPSFRRPCPR